MDVGQGEETHVTLLVHQVKPPSLMRSGVSFPIQRQAVATVKDTTSDFTRMAREGREMLRDVREKKDKKTMRQFLGNPRIKNGRCYESTRSIRGGWIIKRGSGYW